MIPSFPIRANRVSSYSNHRPYAGYPIIKNWRCFPYQAATAPAPGDRYTRGFLIGRQRIFSLFIALTYVMTSPTWPLSSRRLMQLLESIHRSLCQRATINQGLVVLSQLVME